jgi:hypothetical protein
VTALCRFGNPDDESLPLRRCVCGQAFADWRLNLSVYAEDPLTMECCGRKLYFSQKITVYEVK